MYGYATVLCEEGVAEGGQGCVNNNASDIFGIYYDGSNYYFAFASDTDQASSSYGDQGYTYLYEGNGTFDATKYLDAEARAEGFTATFQSDPATVPEPGTLMLFGTGVLSMAGFFRRKIMSS